MSETTQDYNKYTETEEKYIINNYGVLTAKEIAEELEREVSSVREKVKRLNLDGSEQNRSLKERKEKQDIQANQYIVNPRQMDTVKFYVDPNSPTFSNLKASAEKAGYAESTAKQLTYQKPQWLTEMIDEVLEGEMLQQAKLNSHKFLNLDWESMRPANKDRFARMVQRQTNFVLERLGKDEGYSKKEIRENREVNMAEVLDKLENKKQQQVVDEQ